MIRQFACTDMGFALATSSSAAIRGTSAVIKSHTLASGGRQETGRGRGGGDEALTLQRGSGQGLNVQDH